MTSETEVCGVASGRGLGRTSVDRGRRGDGGHLRAGVPGRVCAGRSPRAAAAVSLRGHVAFGGRPFGLLPPGHLPRRRRGRALRPVLPRRARERPVVQTLALAVFVGCMALVCCAGDALTFLLAWEGMTLASYVLVVSDTRSEENARAGLLYLVMAHAGTAALLVVFLTLTERAQAFDFPALRAAARGLDGSTRTAAVHARAGRVRRQGRGRAAARLAAQGAPGGAQPRLRAHVGRDAEGGASTGSSVSASTSWRRRTARCPPSWGWTVLFLGTVSAVIGVLLALQQHDLKRLLAFHSVENVGIILIGAGLAMLLAGGRGHAGAGHAGPGGGAPAHAESRGVQGPAVPGRRQRHQPAPHVRNMEELGGLARRMPWTAWLFLLGAVAISALPPLNGFVERVDDVPGPGAGRRQAGRRVGAARRRCGLDARADRRAGSGLLRQGVRRHLPRAGRARPTPSTRPSRRPR